MMTTNSNTTNANAGAGSSGLSSSLFAAGMVLLFVGERVIGAGTGRTASSALGALLVLAAIALRVMRRARADEDRKQVEGTVLGLMGLGVLALLVYALQSDLAMPLFGGKTLSAGSPKLAGVLGALWPAIWLCSALPLGLVEISYASMIHAPRIEVGRIRDATTSGFGFAFALIFAFSVAYVGDGRDVKVDLSYFRTARPGEATRKIVRALDQSVTIAYFYPAASEVRDEVASYLADLSKESPKLEVKGYDQAVDPAKAKELGASGNGLIVISREKKREQLAVSVELEQAKNQLKNLDKEIQKKLLSVARPGKNVYITVGHGERTADAQGETDKRGTVRSLRTMLTDQNYTLRDLGAADGLAADVPTDAAIVMIIGPTKELLPEEAASIARYVDRGGRLFVALDPEAGLDFGALLSPLGVQFTPVTLANDQMFARRYHQDSDRINIVTGSFSSHPTVATLGKLRAPVIMPGAGALRDAKDKPKGVSVDWTIHAHAVTWDDKNGNFAFDAPAETRKAWELGAAITKKKEGGKAPTDDGRALVLGDSDLITDAVVGNVGNPYVLIDGMKWLLGDEAIAGETITEVDLPIAHTKSQDAWWFYATIFLAPALTLGLGRLITRRRRRARPVRTGSGSSAVRKEAA